jgi:hypothetical protein
MRGQQQDIRFFLEQVFRPEGRGDVRSDHFNLAVFDQHPGKRLSQQAILRGHKDARLPSCHGGAAGARGAFTPCAVRPIRLS